MPLPKIKHPTFAFTVPSTKKEIKLRPYTVQEEKILLIAQASEDSADKIEAVKQVVNNCVEVGSFDVETAPLFDIEYLFIKLRAISVNNITELQFIDEKDITEDGPKVHDFKVDLNKVEVKFNEGHSNTIEFVDGIGAVLRYPNFKIMNAIKNRLAESQNTDTRETAIEALFSIYAQSIEKMFDDDNVYVAGVDFTEQEAESFLDTLNTKQLEQIQSFFETMPSIHHVVEYTTSKGETKTIPLSGLDDFFIL